MQVPSRNEVQEEEPKPTMFVQAFSPVLTVQYNDETKEISLNEPRFTIGRSRENNIVLPLTTVSRLHAVLTRGPEGYVITDQNSTNGLLYQGAKVTERLLADGDVIRIGDELGNIATLTYHDLTRPAQGNVQTLQFTDSLQIITIGRSSDNNLRLNYPQVSTNHAVIRRQGGVAMLEDLGSTNGTFIRGYRVMPHAPVQIEPGEIIYIAGYRLAYQGNALTQPDSGSVRLDIIGLNKTVNKGATSLLNDISLSIQPKEFVAIVGGSGAGKSTLMDALNGFRPASYGKVLINGEDYYENAATYRQTLGYVPQDDIIHSNLTVERALYYAAKLRLPKDVSEKEIEQRVAEVLEDVEMSGRRKLEVARLSGGQRKRVSIAVELLAKPNLFYLDEPTSGLDPGLDKRMMFLLRRLADQGRTIILVTHATNNLAACDKVIFMAPGGRLAFFGPPKEALQFFGVGEFADIYSLLEQTSTSGAEWAARFRQSDFYRHYISAPLAQVPAARQPVPAPAQNAAPQNGSWKELVANSKAEKRSLNKTSSWRQFMILTRRYFELVLRDKVNLLVLLLQAPIIGLVLALVAGDNIFADGKQPVTTQRVLFILAVVAVWFGTSNAAREITKENAIYMRERLVNLKVLPYIMSKVAVLSGLCFIQSVTLVGIVMLRSGVPGNGAFLPGWLEMIIATWLTTLAGMGMGLLVSALFNNADKAGSIVPILLVPQIILAGLIFPLEGASKTLSFAVISRWSVESLGTTANLNRLYYSALEEGKKAGKTVVITPYDPANYDDDPSDTKDYSGNTTLDSRRNHLLVRWGWMAGMIIIFLALTCYFQKRKDKTWNRR